MENEQVEKLMRETGMSKAEAMARATQEASRKLADNVLADAVDHTKAAIKKLVAKSNQPVEGADSTP